MTGVDRSSPGQLTRFGALPAAGGLGGVEVQLFVSSDAESVAYGKVAASRQPGASRMQKAGRRRLSGLGAPDEALWRLADSPDCREFLVFSAPGAVLVCATRNPPGGTGSANPGLAGRWTRVLGQSEQFVGRIRSNPRFLYEDLRVSEFLFTFDPAGGAVTDWGYSALLMDLTAGVASAAAHGQAPIIYMQAPVAPFVAPGSRRRADGSRDRVRESCSLSLRVSLGFDITRPERRLSVQSRLADYAVRAGLGLEMRDRRPGMVRGDWLRLIRREPERLARTKVSLAGERAEEPVRVIRPVTIVGPGRVGSSAACAAILNAAGAGLHGVSITTVQDIGIMNLFLAQNEAAPTDTHDRTSGRISVEDYQSLNDALDALADEAHRGAPATCAAESIELDGAAADHVLVAARRRVLREPAADHGQPRPALGGGAVVPRSASGRWAVWATWNVPGELLSVHLILETIRIAIEESLELVHWNDDVDGPRVDYSRARVIPSGRLRGRAKLSIPIFAPPPPTSIEDYLDDVCSHAEGLCRELLVEHLKEIGSDLTGRPTVAAALGDIRVGWRERWLGQSAPDL
jgi:hypothetical protein